MDAAALATTAPLDLSDSATAPDFTAISFYKIFGFPNIGALIVRKSSAHVMQNRRYFGGGTVDMIISINDTWHAKKDGTIHDRLEDGTLPFHSIFALDHGISVHERLYGPNPMKFISMHTAQLGRKLYEGLSQMMHSNGTPVARIYKDENAVYGDPAVQGATIAFNVQRPDGSLVGFQEVEEAADQRQIYVRSGSLCNPGGVATYLEWSPAEMRAAYAHGHRCANPQQVVFGKATGVVRVSLGAMSIASDVQTFLDFLEDVYVDQQATEPQMNANEFLKSVGGRSADHEVTYQGAVSVRSASRASAGRASQISIPHTNNTKIPSAPPTPSIKSAPGSRGGERFTDNTAMPSNASAHELDSEAPRSNSKNPPFIPSDYLKNRRPWEEEMHKQDYSSARAEAEAKYQQMEEALAAARVNGPNASNTVKARRFGRSVVNLLRQKSNHSLPGNGDHRYDPPDT